MSQFEVTLVGVSFGDRQGNIALVSPGQKLYWRHDAQNPYDGNAVEVFADSSLSVSLGHLRKPVAKRMVTELLAKGCVVDFFVKGVTGGTEGKALRGLVVTVTVKWPRREAP